MSFRMHEYSNGLTGLAAFCDVCGERIEERGFIVWDSSDVTDWLLIHQARCDPGRPRPRYDYSRYDYSMGLDCELVYLANSAGIDLVKTIKRVELLAQI